MERGTFDAGSEWSAPEAAVTTATEAAPPEAVTNPVAEESQEVVVADPWDKDPNDSEVAAKAPAPTTPSGEFEVRGSKGSKKFKMDPNDPELTRTLQMGLDYRRMQSERDQARKELTQRAKDSTPVAEKAKVWDELNELARLGHREKIAQAVLGDEGYARLKEEILLEQAAADSGDPDVRHEFANARSKKDREWQETQYQKKMSDLEGKLAAIEEKSSMDTYRTLGTSALQKHDFRGYVEDADLATGLNNKLWKLAWSDIEELADAGDTITPELVNKTFAANARILRAGQGKAVNERVAQVIEQRKADTKSKLQVAATQQQSGGQTDLSSWTSGKAKDLLKMLVNRR